MKKENNLKGIVAMVTGGATGIGASIVEVLAKDGASVACCYNKSKDSALKLQKKIKKIGYDIYTIKVDVTKSSEIENSVNLIMRYFSCPIGILINAAGDIIKSVDIERMDENLWDKVIEVNLKSVFLCSKYCIPGMKKLKKGRIVNFSSISARSVDPGDSHYAASKGGVESLTKALSVELAPYNITCNAISPGLIYTPMLKKNTTREFLSDIKKKIPLSRIGSVEDVAKLVLFICSDGASYITGETISINGGLRFD